MSISACLALSQLGEMAILEIIEQLGNPAKDQGEWIAKTDLVEAGSKLKLVEHVGALIHPCLRDLWQAPWDSLLSQPSLICACHENLCGGAS